MESPVGDRVQVDQWPDFGVRERRRRKSGKSFWVVEFRPKSSKKIERFWLGKLNTREEANKACDAALHFFGLPTKHYTYPSGHFGEIGEVPQDKGALKERVKSWAEKHAKLPLPIIAATPPTAVASEDSAPQPDHLALQNFQADPTVRNVCEVGSAHNSAAYPIPRVPGSSFSSSPCMEWLRGITKFLMAEDPEDRSLEDSDEYKQIHGKFQACCGTPAREVGAGSADVAINSANEEAAIDFIGSIDTPLASVPRLEAHRRCHRLEIARIEGTDNVDPWEHADMCKSTED